MYVMTTNDCNGGVPFPHPGGVACHFLFFTDTPGEKLYYDPNRKAQRIMEITTGSHQT